MVAGVAPPPPLAAGSDAAAPEDKRPEPEGAFSYLAAISSSPDIRAVLGSPKVGMPVALVAGLVAAGELHAVILKWGNKVTLDKAVAESMAELAGKVCNWVENERIM